MRAHRINWKIGSILAAGLMAAHAAWGQVEATATLQPEEVDFGEASQLQVAISGTTSASRPEIPRVDGLVITYVGHTMNYQMGTGGTSAVVRFIYHVEPHRTGVFTIPEVSIKAGNQLTRTNPVTLRVGKPAAGYPQQTPSQPATQAPAQPQGQAAPSDAPPELSSRLATIQLVYPKRDFYVGELVPAQLKVYLHNGLSITEVSLPTVSGTAFTVGKLGTNPDKRTEMINGRPYTVLTWNTAVAAIKPGEHPLGAQIECKVLVEDNFRRRSSPFPDDFFSDSFSDRFFRNVQEKRVTLKTDDSMVKVVPIPDQGKPDEFSGAIGKFDVTAEASPTDVTAGDPITLKMAVSGNGNFDRVKAPELNKALGFKTYAPSSRFEPEDASGSAGRKVFEEMIVPQRGGIDRIPPITFSYFDPDERKYLTVATSEIPIHVKAAAASASASKPAPSAQATPPAPQPEAGFTASDDGFVHNQLEMGSTISTLAPVVTRPWFWALQGAPLTALTIAWFMTRRRNRLESDPAFARSLSADRTIQAGVRTLDSAAKKQDTAEFFHAGRRVLQERLGEKLGRNPETITLADLPEIQTRLAGSNHDVALWPDVKAVFDVADAIAYSGQEYGAESLKEWQSRILNALKQMEKLG